VLSGQTSGLTTYRPTGTFIYVAIISHTLYALPAYSESRPYAYRLNISDISEITI